MRRAATPALAALALLGGASAAAHGFGQRYDLPVPLSLVLAGAGATVALSFAVMAGFVRHPPAPLASREIKAWPLDGALAGAMLAGARALAALLYLLVIVAGFIGSQQALGNIAPAFVWGVWWVGLAYTSALIGNLWDVGNPLHSLWSWVGALRARWAPGLAPPTRSRWPEWLGTWPAVFLFVAFNWIELVWPGSEVPASLAALIVAYSLLTWLGLWRFGRPWLQHAEVFTVVFGVLARFAPFEVRSGERTHLVARAYGVGLLVERPLPVSMMAIVLTMLAAVSFDGFIDTPAWAAIVEAFGADAPHSGRGAALTTLGLVGAPLLFFGVYLAVCALSARIGGGTGTLRVAGLFVLTLVPIAIAYHLAHYLSLLAMAGQYMIPLASDPLGRGWDLFGGATWFIRPVLIDARVLWTVSVVAIVAGHVAAVVLAHRQALREFGSRRAALASQLPMLVLMVGYTMTSLWILAQPIVGSR